MASQARQVSISPASMPRASQPRLCCSHSAGVEPGPALARRRRRSRRSRSAPTATARPAGRFSRSSHSAIEATTSGSVSGRLVTWAMWSCAACQPLVRPAQGRAPAADLGQHGVLGLAEQRLPPEPRHLGEGRVDVEVQQVRALQDPVVDAQQRRRPARLQRPDLARNRTHSYDSSSAPRRATRVGAGVLEQEQRPLAVGHVPVAGDHRLPPLAGGEVSSTSCSGNCANSPEKIAT